MGLENIIQGHGDVLLRGEIDDAIKENLAYLAAIRKAAKAATRRRNPMESLAEVTIESCGKSRVYLGGLAETLHKRNLVYLYRQFKEESHLASESESTLETAADPDEDEIKENSTSIPTEKPIDEKSTLSMMILMNMMI